MKIAFHLFIVLCFTLTPLAQVFAERTPKSLNGSLSDKDRFISMTVITQEDDIRRCIGCDLGDVLERAGFKFRGFKGSFKERLKVWLISIRLMLT